jgi:hypothetical protein
VDAVFGGVPVPVALTVSVPVKEPKIVVASRFWQRRKIVYVPEGSGRLLTLAVLKRLFDTPMLIGSVVLAPLLVLLSMMTSAQPAELLLAKATTLVVPAGHGAVVTMLKLFVTGPLLGSNERTPSEVPGSSPEVAALAATTPATPAEARRPAVATATQRRLIERVIIV